MALPHYHNFYKVFACLNLSQISFSLNQDETCSSYNIDGNASTEDVVKEFFKSVHLKVRPPKFLITKEKIEDGMPFDFYDLLAKDGMPFENRANDSLSSLDAQIEMLNYEKARLNEWVDGNLELERLQKIPIHFEFQEALKQSSKVADELTSI
ncbi:hypothetical protein Tco_0467760 [Tanacetum coccineum]